MSFKMVYIDDEVDLCQIFQQIFATHDSQIWTFTNARDFLASIPSINPDIAFLDYRLPDGDGFSLAKTLNPSTIKVLMTGEIEIPHVEIFDRVFHKPFDYGDLEEYIRQVRVKLQK